MVDQREENLSSNDEYDPEDEAECPNIRVSTAEKRRMHATQKHSLIIQCLEKRLGYKFPVRRLSLIWKPKALFFMKNLRNDFFLVKFESVDDCENVLFDGLWLSNMSWLDNRFLILILKRQGLIVLWFGLGCQIYQLNIMTSTSFAE